MLLALVAPGKTATGEGGGLGLRPASGQGAGEEANEPAAAAVELVEATSAGLGPHSGASPG